MSQTDTRIANFVNYCGNLDAKTGGAVGPILHLLKREPIHTLLKKIVHIFTSALSIRDDVQTGINLVPHGPADDVVRFLPGEFRFLQRVGRLDGPRIASRHSCGVPPRHLQDSPSLERYAITS
jgi:hypothetical protein